MAYSDIDKPSDYFNTITWTGDGSSSRGLTGVGFQPDWVWLKRRDSVSNQNVYDVIRGATNYLLTDSSNAEATIANRLTSFDSDGFTVGNSGNTNTSGGTYVAWNWLAGGTASSNTDGTITSQVSANTTSGFSIVSWTGSGASNTVAHGLSSAPELVIVKNRTDSATDWRIGNSVVPSRTFADGNGYYLEFDTGAIANPGSQTIWGSPPANPTASVFKVGSNNSNNGSGDDMIAYCFHSVKGYSKIGSYTGNSSTDGTFVYTGFTPAYVMIKRTNATSPWTIFDNKRGQNENNVVLEANASTAEQTPTNRQIDIVSNGFKNRATSNNTNASGSTYIYMAFAENPFVTSTGIPATAR